MKILITKKRNSRAEYIGRKINNIKVSKLKEELRRLLPDSEEAFRYLRQERFFGSALIYYTKRSLVKTFVNQKRRRKK